MPAKKPLPNQVLMQAKLISSSAPPQITSAPIPPSP
jgi:hypothetical protein